MTKYIFDGGHALKGAVGARGNGLCEEIEDRKVVKRLAEMMREHGHTVHIASVDNEADEKRQRYKVAENANKANSYKSTGAIFVSLHLNSFSNPNANGVEVWYYPGSVKGKEVAGKIQKELVKQVGWADRGIKEGKWTVIEKTKMPGVLVEMGFISNKGDMNKFNVEKISKAIFKALTGKEYAKKTNAEAGKKLYKVQCGAFKVRKNAESFQQTLSKKNFSSYIKAGKDMIYRVQLGAFSNRANAEHLKKELSKSGFSSYIVEE